MDTTDTPHLVLSGWRTVEADYDVDSRSPAYWHTWARLLATALEEQMRMETPAPAPPEIDPGEVGPEEGHDDVTDPPGVTDDDTDTDDGDGDGDDTDG